MAAERKLSVPTGYDIQSNQRVASFAAQLDDQLVRLKKDCSELEVHHLEWQPNPGVNTIGMLLAHLAIVDIWWIRIAPNQVPESEADKIFKEIAGIGGDDDGLPLAPDGRHPGPLTGKTLEDYLRMIDNARAVTHKELSKWRDIELDSTYPLRDRIISREWTLYHVLEHFAGHYGQILLLKHLMCDAGILPKPEKK
jgi:uncharacterized damage-inducible protein DinB